MTSIKMQKLTDRDDKVIFPGILPGENEVVVFLAHFDVFSESSVSPKELERAESMSSLPTRQAFLAGRRLLRRVLSHWLSCDPALLTIRLSAEGSPHLVGESRTFFNISHSGGVVMIAFSGERIGADLEKERSLDIIALSDRFFPKEEADLLRRKNDPRVFLRLWTCREAAIKGDGRGLGKLLGSTKVTFAKDGFNTVSIGGDQWIVTHRMIDHCYHAAVATKSVPSLIRWCDLR